MGLLDCTPEIVELIIKLYVNEVGILEAWSRRDVCKTFNYFIEYEVLAKQPKQAFYRTPPKFILQGLTHSKRMKYLQYRIQQPNNAPPVISLKLRGINAEIVVKLQENEGHLQEQYTTALCIAALTDNPGILLRGYGTRDGTWQYDDEEIVSNVDRIAAAASIGDERALRRLILNHPMDVLERSDALGFPLQAAVAGGHMASVKMVLDLFPKLKLDDLDTVQLELALEGVVRKTKNHDMMELIFECLGKTHTAIYASIVEESWETALYKEDRRLLNTILNHLPQLQEDEMELSEDWGFDQLCNNGFGDMARRLIEKGYYIPPGRFDPHSNPMLSAIKYGQADLVTLLIEKGYPVDDFCGCRCGARLHESPLKFAVRHGHTTVSNILIEHGAKADFNFDEYRREAAKDCPESQKKQAEICCRAFLHGGVLHGGVLHGGVLHGGGLYGGEDSE
ncbi:hypothetical protein BU24DRAFT_456556 [Aaosphaeria arxii CBS 175.79]|uniref:Uncharacterized protein n=1 Tax=Aaosphaeria arxii CBS 175.79 TaxID=1450172 RepID=A0A6A5Y4H6_9PLEO|nr:uncharacterized protein BU24DRAFT_456556 [Aaosphaeria arxii CBS 175.79]KAF2020485.1 hypothetical protein BU24DRAFT_456556 [Aaosphaeria arxii CBS 175.79]